METGAHREGVVYLEKFAPRRITSRKDGRPGPRLDETPDGLPAWVGRYLELAVTGVCSETVAEKAALHLGRFAGFFGRVYGHDRISAVVRRDVLDWQRSLAERGLAPATVNNHLASLSAFTTWVDAQAPRLFAAATSSGSTQYVEPVSRRAPARVSRSPTATTTPRILGSCPWANLKAPLQEQGF